MDKERHNVIAQRVQPEERIIDGMEQRLERRVNAFLPRGRNVSDEKLRKILPILDERPVHDKIPVIHQELISKYVAVNDQGQ